MAHFAQVMNGKVQQVIVVNNDAIGGGHFPESEPVGQDFIASIGLDGQWLQCSYSGSFRGAYPGPGWRYDAELDEFTAPPAPVE